MSANLHTRLGQTIRERRAAAGLSQEKFADRVGVHRTFMGNLERGDANPSLEVLERLARGLGTKLSELIGAAEAREPAPIGGNPPPPPPPRAPRYQLHVVRGGSDTSSLDRVAEDDH